MSTNHLYTPLDVRCGHLQERADGLYCGLAQVKLTSRHETQRTTDAICAACPIGRVQRELGCTRIGGRTRLFEYAPDGIQHPEYEMDEVELHCLSLRRRVDWDTCSRCPNTYRPVVQEQFEEARGILNRLGFAEAEERLHQALLTLHAERYNECISDAKSALESCMRTVLRRLGSAPDAGQDLPALWAGLKKQLSLWQVPSSQALKQVASGAVSLVQGTAILRNELGPDHGREATNKALHSQAELVLGCAATLCLFLALRSEELLLH